MGGWVVHRVIATYRVAHHVGAALPLPGLHAQSPGVALDEQGAGHGGGKRLLEAVSGCLDQEELPADSKVGVGESKPGVRGEHHHLSMG